MTDQVVRIEKLLTELGELHTRRGQVEATLRKRLQPLLEKHRPPSVTKRPNEWSTELLDAARKDLEAVEVLVRRSVSEHASVIAMLLQMVFEKLAKARMARDDWAEFEVNRRSHAVATRLIKLLKEHPELVPNVGPKKRQVLGWVEELTRAHPAIAKAGPHLEYPWEGEQGVCNPARDVDIVNRMRDPRNQVAPHLVKLARHFVENFDEAFSPSRKKR